MMRKFEDIFEPISDEEADTRISDTCKDIQSKLMHMHDAEIITIFNSECSQKFSEHMFVRAGKTGKLPYVHRSFIIDQIVKTRLQDIQSILTVKGMLCHG